MRRHERFDVGERAHLDVDVAAGNVQVQSGPSGAIQVTVDAPNAEAFEISQLGDTVTVRDGSRWLSRSRNVRVVIDVPERAELSIRGASTDLTLRGTFAAVRCRTASGDIEIDDVDRLEVATASGDARVGTVRGDASFNTASGDVRVATVTGQFVASLASGDVTVRSVGGSVDIGTASGDVKVGRCNGSDIDVKSISGNIELGLPGGIRVEPHISTISGSVTLPAAPLPAPAPSSETGERRSVRVRLRSMSGDIRIQRVD